MSSSRLLVVLLACEAAYVLSLGDPAFSSPPRKESSVVRSLLTDSQHSKCKLELSELSGSRCESSDIVYSIVSGSVVINSVIDAHRAASGTPHSSVPAAPNRIYNSEIVGSTVTISRNCYSSDGRDNSTINQSRISQSKVHRSNIVKSNMTGNSVSCSSQILLSSLGEGSLLLNSDIRSLRSTRSSVMNSDIEEAYCHLAKIRNSEVSGSRIVDSTIDNSDVSFGSESQSSSVQNSEISKGSIVIKSKIMNSRVKNSSLTNCDIINSDVFGKTYKSVKLINNMEPIIRFK